jgi:hypothetical protein
LTTAEITVDSGARDNGLANMVADLIRANVESSPHKARVFSRLVGSVGLSATDAEVSLTLVFSRGSCVVLDGIAAGVDTTVTTDSESILEMSNVNLVGGLPFLFDAAGRGIVKKAFRGTIKIRGLARHPVTLTRLAIVLSVN